MKKLISILSLIFGLLVSVTAFIACGGNDDENIISSPDSQEAVKSKHITRVDYQGWDMEYVINYDSKGRISSYFGKDGKDSYKVNITYDENTIVEGNSTFYLLNGLITSSDDYSFSYDSSNHLIKKIGSRSISYTWKDNNLASFVLTTKSSTQTVKFEYSDIKVPVNYIPYLFYVGYKLLKRNDPFLAYYGYFGKNSQNLAKKMIQTSDEQGTPSSVTEEYDYTMKDGLPIEIAVKKTTISSSGNESTSNNRIIIEWN